MVVIVTTFSIIERGMGFIYRIFLSRQLGSEGLGIYQIALSILGFLMTITTAGIPVTISRMIIKHKSNKQNSLIHSSVTSGILLSLIVSMPLFLAIFVFPDTFSFIFTDERCMKVLLVVIPGLVFTSVYSAVKGAFWGNTQFYTYSILEFIEELIMLIVGILLVSNMTSMLDGAIRAGFAVLISYLFSFSVAGVVYFAKGGKLTKLNGQFKPLVVSSLPITAMRGSNALINALIALILPVRLMATSDMTLSLAISHFGKLFGMAIPLVFIPATLIGSLALVLVPELSKNYYDKNYYVLKANIYKCLKLSVLVACLIMPIFMVLGERIGGIIYHDNLAGVYLSFSSVIMLPMSINIISTSMLNSLNKERKSLIYFLIGGVVMLACIYFLPMFMGIYSLVVGLFLNFFISAFLNLALLNKCGFLSKKIIKFLCLSIIFILPTTMLTFWVSNLVDMLTNDFLVVCISSVVALVFNLLLYLLFLNNQDDGLFPNIKSTAN